MTSVIKYFGFFIVTLCLFIACQDEPVIPIRATPVATVKVILDETTPDVIVVLPTATAVPIPSPTTKPTPHPTHTPAPYPAPAQANTTEQQYIPYMELAQLPTAPPSYTPLPTPTTEPTLTPRPTPTPTIDFAQVRQQLQANGQDIGFVKIGFHTSVGGNRLGLDIWMRRLDEAGVPFFLKSVDDAGPLFEAQQLIQASGVPHTLVYRRSGNEYDVPRYDLPPEQAAELHWQLHRDAFPPELDPSIVWIETINEVDKNQAEWLGQFALKTADLALADGFKWAAFGWASGEPEPEHWQTPAMLQFLRLAANYPERLAIALHEYSFLTDDIADQYPYKVGRFQQFFQILEQHNIPRPTVLITEWGWEYQDIPSISRAIEHIAWAADLYAPYPQIKGTATWHLGCCFSDVDDQTQRLIAPLTEYALGNYFAIPLPPAQAAIDVERKRP